MNVPDLLPHKEAQSHLAETRHNQVPRARVAIPPLRERISTKLITKSATFTIELDANSIRMMNQFYHQMKHTYQYPASDIFKLAHHVSPYCHPDIVNTVLSNSDIP